MFTITRLAFALAAITVAVLIPATAGGQGAPPAATSAIAQGTCPRGVHDVGDYRWYAARVYKRESVSRRAHRRLAYMLKCQHSAWALRQVERYHKRFKRERAARALAALVFPVRPHLRAIRQCESGGDYRAIDPSGTYTGAYQFDDATWRSVGGSGRARDAPPAEQDRRAEALYRQRGAAPWPVCGS